MIKDGYTGSNPEYPSYIVCYKNEAKTKKTGNTKFPVAFGGDKRDRTADLLNAIQALSQLSYTPKKHLKLYYRHPFIVNTEFQEEVDNLPHFH